MKKATSKRQGARLKSQKGRKKVDLPRGDRGKFDQLLDDAIFGVKKKNPRD